jgi:hypothetical protein
MGTGRLAAVNTDGRAGRRLFAAALWIYVIADMESRTDYLK